MIMYILDILRNINIFTMGQLTFLALLRFFFQKFKEALLSMMFCARKTRDELHTSLGK